jgi:hypothetical protein
MTKIQEMVERGESHNDIMFAASMEMSEEEIWRFGIKCAYDAGMAIWEIEGMNKYARGIYLSENIGERGYFVMTAKECVAGALRVFNHDRWGICGHISRWAADAWPKVLREEARERHLIYLCETITGM